MGEMMDGDLISRSGLKKQLETMVDNCKTLKLWAGSIGQRVADIAEKVLALCIRAVDEATAVDAEPVVHGRWELYPSSMHRRCSVCKMEYEKPKFNVLANYCPNCGAKMDGGE